MAKREGPRLLIGELAELFRIDPQTLRFYDRKGIFHPAGTLANGYRYYRLEQLPRLETLLWLRGEGWGLSEAEKLLSASSAADNLDRLTDYEQELEQKVRRLQRRRSNLHRQIAMAREGQARIGDLSLEELPCMKPSQIIRFVPRDDEDFDGLHKEIFRRFLKVRRESGEFPVFGASLSRERLVSGQFEPPDYLVHFPGFWEGASCSYVSYFYLGRYESIGEGYRKLQDFIQGQKLTVSGDALEIDYIDQGLVQNEDEFITRLLIPVTKAPSPGR